MDPMAGGGYPLALSEQEVRHVARLARLRLDAREVEGLARDLNRVLEYMRQLNELDTESVEPTWQVVPQAAPLRADVLAPSLPVDAALANAPEVVEGMFAVPRIIEGDADA